MRFIIQKVIWTGGCSRSQLIDYAQAHGKKIATATATAYMQRAQERYSKSIQRDGRSLVPSEYGEVPEEASEALLYAACGCQSTPAPVPREDPGQALDPGVVLRPIHPFNSRSPVQGFLIKMVREIHEARNSRQRKKAFTFEYLSLQPKAPRVKMVHGIPMEIISPQGDTPLRLNIMSINGAGDTQTLDVWRIVGWSGYNGPISHSQAIAKAKRQTTRLSIELRNTYNKEQNERISGYLWLKDVEGAPKGDSITNTRKICDAIPHQREQLKKLEAPQEVVKPSVHGRLHEDDIWPPISNIK